MLLSDIRSKVALFSLLVLLLVAIVGWLVWSNSVDRIPQGGVLVMGGSSSPDPCRLVHPYYFIVSRRVMV